MPRQCRCHHGFPVCACNLGLSGEALWAESRRLSSLAGWPARVSDEAIAEWTPKPPPAPLPREAKPRGSLSDAVKQAKECIPCQQRKAETP